MLACRSLLLLAALAVPLALAHPPAADPHHGCVVPPVGHTTMVPAFTVVGALGDLQPPASLPCAGVPGVLAAWGSHASPCPPGIVGSVAGAWCGPLVAPGASAACAWQPIHAPQPLGLVVGWDATGNGLANALLDGELIVHGPIPAGAPASLVPNPHPVPARVIAYPITLNGILDPSAVVIVTCA